MGVVPRFLLASLVLVAAGIAVAADAPPRAPVVGASGGAVPHPPVAPPSREGKVNVDLTQKFTHFRVGGKNVKSLYFDSGIAWVGTSGGVVRYDTKNDSFKFIDTKDGLLSNGMFYVGRVKGRIAVGTYGGGLSLLDEKTGKWQTYNIPEGLGDAFVYDVITAKNGDIWIATWSGANRIRGGDLDNRSKWDLYTVENTKGGLPNDWVYGLAEGKNGDIWLATEGGMARFANNRWENWNHVDVAYNPNYVVALEVDATGVVWAGTWGGGLARFDGKRWHNYTTTEGLPGNHVFSLHLDPKGQLWVGTNNGLTRWQNGKFAKALTTADGLFANNVFAMTSSPDGALWVGSYGGVAHLRPGK